MNTIVDTLIKNNIEKFVQDYKNISRQVFLDESGNLIHPGEFGNYREKIVKELLQRFLPSRLAIGTGFIITSDNEHSTQCDLIIYDKEHTPIIENSDQRFFPIECVAGVVEVKSKLNKAQLKEALIKLSVIKKLREQIHTNVFVYKELSKQTDFNAKRNPYDQLATFVICEEIDMDVHKEIDTFFKETYSGTDKSAYHNMILSIKNGLFLYYFQKEKKSIYLPYIEYEKPNFPHKFLMPAKDAYENEHILTFINYFYMIISTISVMFFEITNYLGASRPYIYLLEDDN